jgi:lysylphosphatidylglycerol synthetase-like protein (DUF2156 family)
MEKPTKEFLEELRERARRYGWSGDYVEVREFVKSLYLDAGLEVTDAYLEPYPR